MGGDDGTTFPVGKQLRGTEPLSLRLRRIQLPWEGSLLSGQPSIKPPLIGAVSAKQTEGLETSP